MKIFVNLPVKDLNRTKEFFTAIGFTFNQQFTDDTAAAMVISEDIYCMLLTEEKFRQFTTKSIADASKTAQMIIALSVNSKQEVDQRIEKAMLAGASEPMPSHDYGFMYQRSIEDLDGHLWEIFWMDPAGINPS